MKMIKWFFVAGVFLPTCALSQLGVAQGREEALSSMEADRPMSQSLDALANDYAFQYRQQTQERLNRMFQNSSGAVRETDPFGAPMGTALRQQVARTVDDESAEHEEARRAMEGFGTAVRGLDIRGINPGRKEILCGADNVFEGDVMDISTPGGIFRVWIVAVKPDSVTFMDHISQQTETITLSLDAPSMTTRNWGPSGTINEAPPF
jgi:hypothetical protein